MTKICILHCLIYMITAKASTNHIHLYTLYIYYILYIFPWAFCTFFFAPFSQQKEKDIFIFQFLQRYIKALFVVSILLRVKRLMYHEYISCYLLWILFLYFLIFYKHKKHRKVIRIFAVEDLWFHFRYPFVFKKWTIHLWLADGRYLYIFCLWTIKMIEEICQKMENNFFISQTNKE